MSWSDRRRALLRSLAAAPTSPSAYLLLVVLLANVVAKSLSVSATAGGRSVIGEALGACAWDLFVYPALAALVVAAPLVRRSLAFVMYPLALLAIVLAAMNAAYVAIANDQIDARMLAVGISRIDEVAGITLIEAKERAGVLGVCALLVVPIGYLLIRRAWRRATLTPDALGRLRVNGLLSLAVLGALVLGATRAFGLPRTLAADLIADNALVHTYATFLDEAAAPIAAYQGALEKHFALPLVAPDAMQRLAQAPSRTNVLFFVLESTRFDHVELPLAGHRSAARTPNLRALAERGTFFTNAYAAMPHTSKSLVTLLCARLPAMENAVLEAADGVLQQCLPELFRGAGYATAFYQSAIGSFEYRPRLTVRLGYEAFGAFETIGAKPIGYLAGDDRSLAPAFATWLASVPAAQPFFATLLTSGTHHPYEVPADVAVADRSSSRQRFAALVEIEDRMVGEAIEALRRAGRLDNTLIIAVADHGEGLAGDAVRQHDNNFFDESLHVPLIMSGPGMRAVRVDRLLSLLDVAPLVLGTAGIATILPDNELRFGKAEGVGRTLAPFACWHDGVCEGFISNDAKIVRMIADRRDLAFDRKPGASERDIREPTDAELAVLLRVSMQNELTRLSLKRDLKAGAITLPSGFTCGRGGAVCAHPSRPEGGFHRPIDDFAGH